MPAFIRNKSDEKEWERAKEAAAKQTSRGSKSFWKLSNYIWHKMHKGEEHQKMAELYKKELMKFGGMMSLGLSEKNVKSPMHSGSHDTSIKTPRPKKLPGPDAKPSVFFKMEEIHPKHPSAQKLYDFLARRKIRKGGE